MKKQNRVAFFNILSVVLLRGISLFTMPLFTRLLGTAGYGVTTVYSTWASAIAILFTLQTQATLVNARVEYPEEKQREYQSSVMALSVLVYFAFGAVVLCFLGPVSQALKMDKPLVLFMLAQAFGTFCVEFLNTKYVYEFKAGRNMLLSVAVSVLTLVLSVVLVLSLPEGINYYGRVAAVAATYTILGVPICIAILAKGRVFYRAEYWKFCVALAVPAMFHNLSDLILGQSDKVMIQQMLGDSAVGVYSAALGFGGIMFTIFQALNNSWCPFFFDDLKAGEIGEVRRKAANFQELYTVLSLGFILLTREVYRMYVSQDYWDGLTIIPIFVTNYYLNFLCTYPVNFEYYHKKTKVVAAVTISASLLNIVLNYILILAVGAIGAAIATMLSHMVQLICHYGYCRYLLGKGSYPFGIRLWWKGAAAYAVGVALVYLTQDLWPLRWGLGAALGVWELLRIRKRKTLL